MSTGMKEATSDVHFIFFPAGMQEANCDAPEKVHLEAGPINFQSQKTVVFFTCLKFKS